MSFGEYDQRKLDTAITYVQRIAEGCNPVTNKPAEDDSIINDPNVIRCMYFIATILKDVKDHTFKNSPFSSGKLKTDIQYLKVSFKYRKDKTLSDLVQQINAPAKKDNMQCIKRKNFFDYLLANGYMDIKINADTQRKVYLPTDKGTNLGIRKEYVEYPTNSYWRNVFNQNAQEFIVCNLEKISVESVIVPQIESQTLPPKNEQFPLNSENNSLNKKLIGKKYTLRNEDGEILRIQIVNSSERFEYRGMGGAYYGAHVEKINNSDGGKKLQDGTLLVSIDSPLANALAHTYGDRVIYEVDGKQIQYTIVG